MPSALLAEGGHRPRGQQGGVIVQHLLDANAVGGKERPGSAQELRADGTSLISQDLGVGQPAVVVDGGMDVVVARPGLAVPSAMLVRVAAVHAVAAIAEPPELLDVHMDQLTQERRVRSGGSVGRRAGPGRPTGSGHGDTAPGTPSRSPARPGERSGPGRWAGPGAPADPWVFQRAYQQAVVPEMPISAATWARGRPAAMRWHRIAPPAGEAGVSVGQEDLQW